MEEVEDAGVVASIFDDGFEESRKQEYLRKDEDASKMQDCSTWFSSQVTCYLFYSDFGHVYRNTQHRTCAKMEPEEM